IAYAVPLVCPLLAYCMMRLTQRWRSRWWRYRYPVVVVAGILIGFFASSGFSFLRIAQEALHGKIVSTPRGGTAVFGGLTTMPELLARIAGTPSGDAFFFYPTLSMLSFLTAREQVSKYDLFMPGYTLPSQYQDACISEMENASWAVSDRRQTESNVLKQRFPAMRDADPPEKQRFEQALDGAFALVAQEGRFELRHRREGISDTVCAGI